MKKITIVLAGVIVLGAVLLITIDAPESNIDTRETTQGTSDITQVENEVNEIQSDDTSKHDTQVAGTYETYTPEKITQQKDKKIVLFFKASWCPSCRVLDTDIQNSLEDIPSDVTILEVDFDTNTELRKKYGVTTQHTLVEIDTAGNQVQKWSGGSTLETILTRLN